MAKRFAGGKAGRSSRSPGEAMWALGCPGCVRLLRSRLLARAVTGGTRGLRSQALPWELGTQPRLVLEAFQRISALDCLKEAFSGSLIICASLYTAPEQFLLAFDSCPAPEGRRSRCQQNANGAGQSSLRSVDVPLLVLLQPRSGIIQIVTGPVA